MRGCGRCNPPRSTSCRSTWASSAIRHAATVTWTQVPIAPRSCRARPRTAVRRGTSTKLDPERRHHRWGPGAQSQFPVAGRAVRVTRPARDGPLQSHNFGNWSAPGLCRSSSPSTKSSSSARSHTTSLLVPTCSEAMGCSRKAFAHCAGSTSSATGKVGQGLRLVLVTNPVGAVLPAAQLCTRSESGSASSSGSYDVSFDALHTITNMPISRYLEWLLESGNLEGYMRRLDRIVQSAGRPRGHVPKQHLGRVGWAPL